MPEYKAALTHVKQPITIDFWTDEPIPRYRLLSKDEAHTIFKGLRVRNTERIIRWEESMRDHIHIYGERPEQLKNDFFGMNIEAVLKVQENPRPNRPPDCVIS